MEGEKAYLARMIDDCVKHISKEHNQEADHLANLGTEEQRKITSEECRRMESKQYVVIGMAAKNKMAGFGCRVVIKAGDREIGSQSAELQCRGMYVRP